VKVAALLKSHPMIAASLARRYPTVICDEHQDSSGDQHSVVMGLLGQGARVRIFGDPMQDIFKGAPVEGAGRPYEWDELKRRARASEELGIPHRWSSGCPDLGQWTLKAREVLKAGGKVDVCNGIPPSVQVVFAENLALKRFGYQLSSGDGKLVHRFVGEQPSLLILTRYNETARSFRSFFYRQIPLWEGHTRPALEGLVDATRRAAGDPGGAAAAIVEFMPQVGTGFGSSAFGDRLVKEAQQGCTGKSRGKTSWRR
jgi:UvrD/REP helicase N-terminal domain